MKDLPTTDRTLVIRTSFVSDPGWAAVCTAMSAPAKDVHFQDEILCLSDPDYDGLSAAGLAEVASDSPDRRHAFLADAAAITQEDFPILAVDLADSPGRSFRVIACEMWSLHSNLKAINMSFREYADRADPDGVYRGFGPRYAEAMQALIDTLKSANGYDG
jgi:hypothetical protein